MGRVLAHRSDCVGLCMRAVQGRESRGGGVHASRGHSKKWGKNGGGYLPYGHGARFSAAPARSLCCRPARRNEKKGKTTGIKAKNWLQ